MNTRETNEIRELTTAELDEVMGAACANGAHINEATLTVRDGQAPRTPVAYFGGIPIY